ncbi:FtsX-like permease family protein [Cellulomonas sp. PS-H5]|uniref:ABC transporter permease n=1 Tax=Cellulomonas sp. PS-H5 TaxID=2820400 RepID=UPI001C4F35F2|nr:FtsX-like permease family protein [Cellulomonas sp. PS-H5]MBW0252654.1 FtsX-like permease family protein [Cellulomonas sp. PS-H5]
MSAVGAMARSAVRVHRGSLAGSALVVALAAALLTATGVWVEAGTRLAAGASDDPAASMLLAVASSFAGTAVLIALLVVASTFAGALRPRAREFALLRAVGATTGQVRQLVTAEVLLVFAVAAPVGAVPGLLLAPLLSDVLAAGGVVPAGYAPALSPWPVLGALALLVPTALLGARLAGRESARLSPASAVQQAAVEPRGIPRGRALTAAALVAAGLVAALVPFALPGIAGAAAATTSAIVLLIAAALVGPLLVRWGAERGLRLTRGSRAVPTLALTNARGFSRRLTGAVLPLALLLALGTVQSGANAAIVDAAEQQVRDGVVADVVARDPGSAGVPEAAAAEVAALPGVAAAGVTAGVPAQVRTDAEDEDLPFLDGLSWEPATLRTVPAETTLLDPDVRSGSLDDLGRDGTIAVSSEAALGSTGLGRPVEVRVGGESVELTVVAVYERGLGLGDYLIGSGTTVAAGAEGGVLLVRADDPAAAGDVRAAVAATGLDVTDPAGYAASVRDAAAGEQGLSTALLLALLAFVAVAAGTTLVGLVGTRRAELALLRRTGATRAQLIRMVAAESALITGTAVGVGLAAVLPALLGVGQGLLGVPVPVLDPVVLGGLLAVVALIGLTLPVAAAVRATRPSAGGLAARAA